MNRDKGSRFGSAANEPNHRTGLVLHRNDERDFSFLCVVKTREVADLGPARFQRFSYFWLRRQIHAHHRWHRGFHPQDTALPVQEKDLMSENPCRVEFAQGAALRLRVGIGQVKAFGGRGAFEQGERLRHVVVNVHRHQLRQAQPFGEHAVGALLQSAHAQEARDGQNDRQAHGDQQNGAGEQGQVSEPAHSHPPVLC